MKKTLLLFLTTLFSCYFLFSQDFSDTIHVSHYEINLSILDFTGKTIEGYTVLDVVPKKDNVNVLRLDLSPMTVDSITIGGNQVNYVHNNSKLTISLSSAINRGDTTKVFVYYHGTPERDTQWGGFHFSGEYAFNMGVGMGRVPHSYGRSWYPCLDVFTDKSTYRCNIRTSANKKAICGGLLSDTTHLSDSTIVWTWDLTQPVPTYLSSVAVGEYALYTDTFVGMKRNIPIEIYTSPSIIEKVPGSFANLKTILERFEYHFGPYQFDKVGYVTVNFNAGAMEHATNIAYPAYAVNGNITYQLLWAHELSHSWFGNLVTCDKAEEMWINEGFARYCEILTDEFLYHDDNPLLDPATVGFRNLHRSVLKTTHTSDGGYYAVDAVPQNVTYGSTTYDKGGVVAHTLRHYLGDSLFYKGMRSLFHDYAFKNINSIELCDYLTQITGVPMRDFYEAWINQPGFLHFSIDSIRLSQSPNRYKIYVRQKLHQATRFGNSNKIDLTFFSEDGRLFTQEKFQFSGETGMGEIDIPFVPVFGVVDYFEKMGDAVIDYNLELFSAKSTNCSDAVFTVQVAEVADTVLLRVEHNLVAPDPLKNENPNIYRLSQNHYWRVEYIAPGKFEGEFHFRFAMIAQSHLDYGLLEGYTTDDLVLLYRRDATDDWRIIPSERTSIMTGVLKSNLLLPGEYTLGAGNRTLNIEKIAEYSFSIYPVPSGNYLTYQLSDDSFDLQMIELYDNFGKLLKKQMLKTQKGEIDIRDLSSGHYLIRFIGKKGTVTKKFIKE